MLAIYVRVSTKKQARDGFSINAQIQKGIEKAKELKSDYRIFEEPGKSASSEKIEDRPELSKIMKLIEAKKIKSIYVTEFDRLSRNEIVSAYMKIAFQEYNIIIYTVNQPAGINFSNFEDEFVSGLLTLLAKRENKQRVERSKRAKIKSIENGKWRGGMPNFGYTTDDNNNLVVDEEEKKIYLKMVDLHLSGMGTNRIAKWLNDNEIVTKSAKTYIHSKGLHLRNKYTGKNYFKPSEMISWVQPTVLNILKNPIYIGQQKYKGKIYQAPSIIPVEKWNKIQRQFQKNKITNKRNAKRDYLLKGLLVCSHCKLNLFGLTKPARNMEQYTCLSKKSDNNKKCDLRSINLKKIDTTIWLFLTKILVNPGVLKINQENKIDKKTIEKEIKNINNNIKSKEEEQERLIELYMKRRIDEKKFDDYSKEIDRQIQLLKNEIETKKIQVDEAEKFDDNLNLYNQSSFKHEILQGLQNNFKRQFLFAIIDKIKIAWNQERFDHNVEILLHDFFDIEDRSMKFWMKDRERFIENFTIVNIKNSFNLDTTI